MQNGPLKQDRRSDQSAERLAAESTRLTRRRLGAALMSAVMSASATLSAMAPIPAWAGSGSTGQQAQSL